MREKVKKKYSKGKKEIIIKVKKNIEILKKSRLKRWIFELKTKHKILFFSMLLLLFVFFVIFGANTYLLFNFLLGHDTLVQLTADNQNFFVHNSQTKPIEFSMHVSTNIFCEATCDYLFEDLSSGYVLDKNSFNTSLVNSNRLKYSLVAPERGEGQILYHFEVNCKSKKSILCKTDEKETKRSFLVALNYGLSPEQKSFKEKSSQKIKDIIFETDFMKRIDLENNEMKEILEEVIEVDSLPKTNLSNIGNELDRKIESWKNYNYEIVLTGNLSEKLNETKLSLIATNDNLTQKFNMYNEFKSEIGLRRLDLLALISNKNITEDNFLKIKSLLKNYNDLINNTNKVFDLNKEYKNLKELSKKINQTKLEIIATFAANYTYESLGIPQLKKIIKPFKSNYSSGRLLQSGEPLCCYKGDCKVCCDDSCKNDSTKYPIILVHGHSFNSAISAESSLGDLSSIQNALIKDGVIDGGYIIVEKLNESGTFSKTNNQIVFASSYYFDIYQEENKVLRFQTKAESLDTYALRLNNIIENVKKMTNRDKVYIVAHSMGGLVTRRYMQIFGADNVEKLIMIATPNHGIDGYVLSGCPLFGSAKHCDAMNKESLFLNKLNYGEIPNTNVTMIIGTGCQMDKSNGDGIVKNESAYLSWAKNYYIEGNCSGIDFLHKSILDVERYPKTYEIVKKELDI